MPLTLKLVLVVGSAMSPRHGKGRGRRMRILVMRVLVDSGVARVVVVVVRYSLHRRTQDQQS
jgi:hypothetical protein